MKAKDQDEIKGKLKVRTELNSNADWILFREVDGSVVAEPRKGGTKQKLSAKSLRNLRSLAALVEGSGVKIE